METIYRQTIYWMRRNIHFDDFAGVSAGPEIARGDLSVKVDRPIPIIEIPKARGTSEKKAHSTRAVAEQLGFSPTGECFASAPIARTRRQSSSSLQTTPGSRRPSRGRPPFAAPARHPLE